ncbi:MAG: amidase [Crocinitomicaceae bacterium]
MKQGELTSLELVQTALKQLEQLNPSLNALVLKNAENALHQAEQADFDISQGKIRSVLHGIPITIKDNIEVEGLTTTAAFPPFKNNISSSNAALVAKLKEAGAVVIGKTNLPALTYDLQTNNQLFGRTNNPWNPDHTSGGSSGGCAAAVSSGISRISFCNDSGGSIRIPAHFCGVYGFKASMGGIDARGIITQTKKKVGQLRMRTLFSMGIMAQSLSDIKAALTVVCTPKLHSTSKKERSPSSLKLLWIDELKGLEIDSEIKTAMTELRKKLTESGVSIEDLAEDQFNFHETIRLWGHLSNYETGNELPPLTRSIGHLIMKRKYSKIPMYTDLLKPISAKKYKTLRRRHEQIKAQFEKTLSSYDGLILPASSVLAFPHQKPDRRIGHLGIYTTPLNVNGNPVQYAIATQSYSLPFNVLESPVACLPIALSKNNLPIGIQLVGKKNFDFDLLEVAQVLDQLTPSIGRPPIKN